MKKALSSWNLFWFEHDNLLGLAAMRVLLCGSMLYMYLFRIFRMEDYSAGTWIPRELSAEALPKLLQPAFSWMFWPDTLSPVMHVILIVLLFFLLLGVGGRWLMWMAWIINAGFIQRNYSVNFGADIIANLLLFYMAFTQSCARLSIIPRQNTQPQSDFVTSAFTRMIQVQMCAIYAFTGWEKLKGGTWWDGTALWSVMANPQMTTMDFTFLRDISFIFPLLAYATVIFEVYFPVMVAWSKTRHVWLSIGVGFHLGIAFLMGLFPFATVMLSSYFLFMDKGLLERMLLTCQGAARRNSFKNFGPEV